MGGAAAAGGAVPSAPRALGGHHRARLLQAGQGGVDGAERDVGQEAQVLAQLAPDLVAVEVPLFEEAQDGQSNMTDEYIGSI